MSHSDPNYYAIIPAPVRYCKDITPNAKLLYGEIAALCGKEGFCWATNAYFANLYEVGASTISEWVASLSRNGFIRVSVDPSRGNLRKIYLCDDSRRIIQDTSSEKSGGSSEKADEGLRKKPKPHIENNTMNKKEVKSLSKDKAPQGSLIPVSVTDFLPPEFNNPAFMDAWAGFVEHRKSRKAPLTDRAIKLLALDLSKWGVRKSIESINETIKSGKWTGLFEPKTNGRGVDQSEQRNQGVLSAAKADTQPDLLWDEFCRNHPNENARKFIGRKSEALPFLLREFSDTRAIR